MSCGGLHHACECRQELLDDALDAISTMVTGIERFLEENPKMRNKIYTDFFIWLPSSKSVLKRSRAQWRN